VNGRRPHAHVRAPKALILGHASAAMTMDLYGHLIDQNLWDAARKIGGTTGARRELEAGMKEPPGRGNWPLTWGFGWSRLSESNRRPSHYEEDLHRHIRSLAAVLSTRRTASCANFLRSSHHFVPQLVPRPGPRGRRLAAVLFAA
jgi:hypothetical protein